ncbi:p-hydroxybenzoic acid efflux pump subunit AaeA [compost metagenome]
MPVKILLDDKDQLHPYPAGTTATVVITGKNDRATDSGSPFVRLMHRLREFG